MRAGPRARRQPGLFLLLSLAAAVPLPALASACAGLRPGKWNYRADLTEEERKTFRELDPIETSSEQGALLYDEGRGVPALHWAREQVRMVPVGSEPGGKKTPAPVYRGSMSAGSFLGLFYYRTQMATWSAETGANLFHNARSAWLGGFLASHERTEVTDLAAEGKDGVTPRVVDRWSFLLGIVGYREEDDRRRILFLGIPIPLAASKP